MTVATARRGDPAARPPGLAERFHQAALALGDELVGEAGPGRWAGGVRWTNDVMRSTGETHEIVRGDQGTCLYDGTGGIALFLGALAASVATGSLRRDLAATAEAAARESLADVPELLSQGSLGYYDGATGMVAAVHQVARSLALPELSAQAADAARQLARAAVAPPAGSTHPRAGTWSGLDLISGDAGICLGLLQLNGSAGDTELRRAAHGVAQRLAESSVSEPWGRSWSGPQDPDETGTGDPPPNLVGFAHGTAGAALALAETASATGDRRLADAAHEALRYDRSWFCAERGGWPDLRPPEGHDRPGESWPSYPCTWCHGAIGVGLTKLRIFELSGDRMALADASAALQAGRDHVIDVSRRVRDGAAVDASVCHGLAGTAELWQVAAEVLGPVEHHRAASRVGQLLLASVDAAGGGWTCGLPGGGEVPGLLLGRAGIGMTLLRLANPSVGPSHALPGPRSAG